MKKFTTLLWAIVCICCFVILGNRLNAQINGIEPVTAESDAQAVLRSNLHLQEQLNTALRAIEQARQDSEASARKNADVFAERMNSVEKNLSLQRDRDLETMRHSNQFVLMAASVLAGVGILALLGTTYFQIRAMNRMAEIGTLVSTHFPVETRRALSEGNSIVPTRLNSAEQASARLLATIEHLEKRIHELDSTTQPATATLNHGKNEFANKMESSNDVLALLAKGETLLGEGDAEKALVCFEEALAVEPMNTDLFLKKGSALEALRRMPEAIEIYDRAIATDPSMTVAYLYKGGALNRLQRFTEAMECYEQALRTHPKNTAA